MRSIEPGISRGVRRQIISRFRIGTLRAPSGMTSETSNQIATRGQRRGAVLAERLDDVAADSPLMHFVGPVDQPLRAHLRVPLRQDGILPEAERAEQLDRGVVHAVHLMRQIHPAVRGYLTELPAPLL